MACPHRDYHQNYLVTLHSDPDEHNAQDFVYTLTKPLLVPRGCYDVGLLEFRCFQPTVTNGPEIPVSNQRAATPIPSPIFPTPVAPVITRTPYVYVKQENTIKFMLHFGEAMKNASFPLKLGAYFPYPGAIVIELEITSDDGVYVVLPEIIAEVFGFRRRLFGPGKHASEFVLSESAIDLLSNNRQYQLEQIQFPSRNQVISLNRRCTELAVVWFTAGWSVQDFVKLIERKVKNYDYDITMDHTKDDFTYLKFGSRRMDKQDYIKFPEDLNVLFGFENIEKFYPGEYTSAEKISQDVFDSLTESEKFVVELNKAQNIPIPMQEPEGRHYLQVLSAINNAFSTTDHDDSRPQFVIQYGRIRMINVDEKVQVKLPPAICNYFGIPTTTWFTNKTSMQAEMCNPGIKYSRIRNILQSTFILIQFLFQLLAKNNSYF